MIPPTPLILTALGLIPFLWGALTLLIPDLALWSMRVLGARFTGPYVQLAYGQVILAFMSGVLWGFAAGARSSLGYALSVIPALWAFAMVGGGPVAASVNLIVGFIAVLGLDAVFDRHGLTPDWWMRLRLPVTGAVIACLAVGVL